MLSPDRPFRVEVGPQDAQHYPAGAEIKDRLRPGLRYELAVGSPWRWVGQGGPIEVELIDVLAAAGLARITGHRVDRNAILQAHAEAIDFSLQRHELLLVRLQREQAAALDTIDEWDVAELLGIEPRSVGNFRRNRPQRIPPPIDAIGRRYFTWLWARSQVDAWIAARPGKGWQGPSRAYTARDTTVPPGERIRRSDARAMLGEAGRPMSNARYTQLLQDGRLERAGRGYATRRSVEQLLAEQEAAE